MRLTLYHYTDEKGLSGILAGKVLRASTAARNPRDVRYGDGQYLTDIAPGTRSPASLSRILIGFPFQARRFSHYVEIDATGLELIVGREGVLVVPGTDDLGLRDRIVSSGPVPSVTQPK